MEYKDLWKAMCQGKANDCKKLWRKVDWT